MQSGGGAAYLVGAATLALAYTHPLPLVHGRWPSLSCTPVLPLSPPGSCTPVLPLAGPLVRALAFPLSLLVRVRQPSPLLGPWFMRAGPPSPPLSLLVRVRQSSLSPLGSRMPTLSAAGPLAHVRWPSPWFVYAGPLVCMWYPTTITYCKSKISMLILFHVLTFLYLG